MLLSQTQSQELGSSNDLTTLVTALPSQGVLHPLEKRMIHFRFSPRYTKSNEGWTRTDQPPPRKDYTLFMHIEMVGSVAGISDMASSSGNRGAVALTQFEKFNVYAHNNIKVSMIDNNYY